METVIREICNAFKKYGDQENFYIMFSQMLPDSATSVKIYTRKMSWKEYYNSSRNTITPVYRITVSNDRSDSVLNSSPITEVFAKYLPKMAGYIEVSDKQLAIILTDLMTAKRYFGIRVGLFDSVSNVPIFDDYLS